MATTLIVEVQRRVISGRVHVETTHTIDNKGMLPIVVVTVIQKDATMKR